MNRGSFQGFLSRTLCVAAGVYLLYVITVALLLNTPLLNRLMSLDPKGLSIEYKRGWSILPGLFHVDQVRILGHDPNVDWEIDLDQVVFRCRFGELFKKRFHVTRVSADRTSFVLKSVDADQRLQRKSKGPSKADPTAWRLVFDAVELPQLAHVQIGEVTFKGNAKVSGRFNLWPKNEAEISNAVLEISDGQLDLPEMALAQKVRGHIQVQFEKFSIPNVSGSQVLRYLNADMTLQARVKGLQFINYYLHKMKPVRLGRADGQFNSRLTVRRGVIVQGSEAEIKAGQISFHVFDQAWVHGQGNLLWRVSNDAASISKGNLRLRLSQFKAEGLDRAVLFQGKDFEIDLDSTDLDLVSPFDRLNANVRFRNAVIPNLKHWNQIITGFRPLRLMKFEGGEGTFSMNATAQAGKPTNKSKSLKSGLKVHFKNAKIKTSSPDAESEYEILPEVSINAGRLNVQFDETARLTSSVTLKVLELGPWLRFAERYQDLPGILMNTLSPHPLVGRALLTYENKRLKLNDVKLEAGSTRAQGNARVVKGDTWAKFFIDHGLLFKLGLSITPQKGLETKLFPGKEWSKRDPYLASEP